jgi:hypothetical protein
MSHKIDELILQLENYLECWKQFIQYVNLARKKEFNQEQEDQFLEVKSILIQEFEMILSAFESGAPNKEEVHGVIGSAPSIRFLSELNEGSLRGLENQWHKLLLTFQSLLGQLKATKKNAASNSMWGRMFKR